MKAGVSTDSKQPTAFSVENNEDLWFIHGKAYDLKEFMWRHPGGSRAMEVSRGRDCTELFESYHSLTDKPKQIMEKFFVGVQEDYRPMFNWQDEKINAFQNELRVEVREYFKKANVDSKISNFRLTQLFLGLIVVLFITIKYYWMQTSIWSMMYIPILWWVMLVNSFHDASHYALSRNHYITAFWQYIYPYFTSPTTWDHQHIIAHHVYTNIHKMDPDLNHGVPVFRMHPHFRWKWMYNFQFVMVWVVWGVATFWLCNTYDYNGIMSGKYHGVLKYQKLNKFRLVAHLFGRFMALFIIFLIPFVFGCSLVQSLLMGAVFTFIFSFCFMMTTQINHFAEDLLIHRESDQQVSPCWSIHQVHTAQDFAHDSMFWWIFAGGLNFQIEHHLFPGVNHEHLPNLKPIVKRLCEKHGVTYHYESTYAGILRKYLKLVGEMSNKFTKGSYEKLRQERGERGEPENEPELSEGRTSLTENREERGRGRERDRRGATPSLKENLAG
jgi:fatty acid desaturase